MRTINFQTALHNALRQMGWDPDVATTAQKARGAASISMHTERAWQFDFWPELTKIEERPFADQWHASVTFAADDVVWDATAAKYYTSLQAGNLNHATSEAGWWEETAVGDLDTLCVDWEQRGQTRIGEVAGLYATELEALKDQEAGSGMRLDKAVTPAGIRLLSSARDTVWVRFRPQPPRFSANLWQEGAIYAEGEVVLWPSSSNDQQGGECYRATIGLSGAFGWEKQELPALFEKFLMIATVEDLLAFEQHRQADYTVADDELLRVNKVQLRQQGQLRRQRFVA